MQKRVDQNDYRDLAQAKDIVDTIFLSENTDWFPAEQTDLHDASSAMARLLDSLRQESPIRAIASRIITDMWQDHLASSVQDEEAKFMPQKSGRPNPLVEIQRKLRELERKRNKKHPDTPESIRDITDWDKVKELIGTKPAE